MCRNLRRNITLFSIRNITPLRIMLVHFNIKENELSNVMMNLILIVTLDYKVKNNFQNETQ